MSRLETLLQSLSVQYNSKVGYVAIPSSGSASKKDLAAQLGAKHHIDYNKEDVAA